MAYKVNNNGKDDFIVQNDGVSETNGLSYKTRNNQFTGFVSVPINVTKNDHFMTGRVENGLILTFILPDSGTDGVEDGQEMIIRVLDVNIGGSGSVRVQCDTDGIRQLLSSSVVFDQISLSANQSYHYIYSSALGYWLQIK